ncbi:glycosyltransferase family 62 protein [Sodiomyces alcalophilus JCM 7366]|uniref:glycosyltransferase family 62 protein n=1 Tax=Sodiomyces alcalophilus JCM 7366 TaxID=591952 RepID=UPI0039B5467B
MVLPKHNATWKASESRLLSPRGLWLIAIRSRLLLCLAVSAFLLLLWRGFGTPSYKMDRFYCWGPPKAPMDMSTNERVAWTRHLQTPVIFNHHAPIEVNATTIQHVNLNPIKSTPHAIVNEERVLILTPLKDAAQFLTKYFELLVELTYPHHLIDLAFLVGDSEDDTFAVLAAEINRLQQGPAPFRSTMIVEKDFHFQLSQEVKERHSYEAQGPRRKALGRARNYLLSAALKPEHSWVYWRDVDIEENPPTIIEDFVAHDVDILVPNIWFHRYEDGVDIEGRFDYNSWIESPKGIKLTNTLPKDVILAEGYKEVDTGRTYLATMGDRHANKHVEVELDGVGGVSIMVKADVHRSGINFPCYAFENQAETEGFAKMAKRAGYKVVGLPNYVVWHVDTLEEPGNA